MNRKKTATALSAGAIANLALAGFVAAPAGAAAHGAAGGAITPSTGQVNDHIFTMKASPQQLRDMAAWRMTEKVEAVHNPGSGFVPQKRVRQEGVKPYSYSYCQGNTCFGVHGPPSGGRYVSYIDEHFFGWNRTCHIGHIWVSGVPFSTYPTYICSNSNPTGPHGYRVTINHSLASGSVSGNFNNVNPYPTRLHAYVHS